MQGVTPNRMTLLERKSQIKLAAQGADLLRKRRDALLQELFTLLKPLRALRRAVLERSQGAARAVIMATALDGRRALGSAELASKRELELRITGTGRTGWELEVPGLVRTALERGYSPKGTGSGTIEAGLAYERLLEIVLKMAPLEMKLRRLGGEIKRTTRRVNALEQRLLPRLSRDVKTIQAVLEEREREEIFRLKRLKGKSDPGGPEGIPREKLSGDRKS